MNGFCAAHTSTGLSAAQEAAIGGFGRSLALPDGLRSAPTLAPFFSAPPADCKVDTKALGKSYNSIEISVHATQPGLVFIGDAWSPGWKASVNGSPSEIFPALGAFKAVVVPAGASEVSLRFSPPFVGAALLGSYALLVAVALGTLKLSRGGSPIR